MKEERLAILRMLENGTISVEEAERLLNAVKETGERKDLSESLNNIFSKTGVVLESLGKKAGTVAKTVGEKAEEAKPEIIKAAKTVKDMVGETADSIKEDIKKRRAESAESEVYEAEFKEKTEEDTSTDEAKAESTVDKAVHAEDFNEELREAEYNKMMNQMGGEDADGGDDVEEDSFMKAQKEWEEMKNTEDNGEVK